MASTTDTAAVPEGLRIIEVTSDWAIAELERQHCIASVWRGQPTKDVLQRRGKELAELTQRFPGKCGMVEIVEPTSKPPTDQDRKVAMDAFRSFGENLSCIGFVVEGSEMRSALTRAIITGMLFFVKQPQPTKVFRNSRDMATWVHSRVDGDQPAFESEMVAALEHLRSLIAASAPVR